MAINQSESDIYELDASVAEVQHCETKLRKARQRRNKAIRALVKAGITYRSVAVRAGVSPQHVNDVVHGKDTTADG